MTPQEPRCGALLARLSPPIERQGRGAKCIIWHAEGFFGLEGIAGGQVSYTVRRFEIGGHSRLPWMAVTELPHIGRLLSIQDSSVRGSRLNVRA